MFSPEKVAQAARLFDAGAKPVAGAPDCRRRLPLQPWVENRFTRAGSNPADCQTLSNKATTQKQESAGVIQENGAGDEMFSGESRPLFCRVGESGDAPHSGRR